MKTILKIFILAFLICAFIVSSKFIFSHKFPNRERGLWGACEMRAIDNLFIGSSMFRKGLDIGILESNLGKNSYILSYNGNQPISILIELESLLKRGVKVKNLYVDMYVFSLYSKPNLSDERLIWDLAPIESLELFKALSAGRSDRLNFAYSYFFSSNMYYLATYPISNYFISKRYRKGGSNSVAASNGMTEAKAATLDLSYLKNAENEPNAAQVDAISKIVKLASDTGINLTFIDTIKYKSVYESKKYNIMISKYGRILKRLGVKYVRFAGGLFAADSSNFSDGVHLSGKGARDFTLLLCEELLKPSRSPSNT